MAEVWEVVREQLRDLLYATTAADVVNVLSWERNPLGHQHGTADGFFAGAGGSATVWDALRKAGWRTAWSGAENHYVMRAPDGTHITYLEGDIYLGDRRPEGEQ